MTAIDITGVLVDDVDDGADDVISARRLWTLLDRHGPGDLRLRFNSCGGSIRAAWRMRDMLRAHRGRVHAEVVGRCCSAAVAVLLCGEDRTCSSGSRFMLHAPYSAIVGTTAELREHAADLERATREFVRWIAERTGQPRSVVAEWLSGEDRWFSPAAAIEAGLVHRVTGVRHAAERDLQTLVDRHRDRRARAAAESARSRLLELARARAMR